MDARPMRRLVLPTGTHQTRKRSTQIFHLLGNFPVWSFPWAKPASMNGHLTNDSHPTHLSRTVITGPYRRTNNARVLTSSLANHQ